jgi:predicted DNA-binding transcriptional regulator YafY
MSDTLLRSIQMLQLIPRYPRKIETTRICDSLKQYGFDVSVRTIQRDLIKLSSIYPLDSDERNKPYGWSWKGSDAIGFPAIDTPTALACVMAERFLSDVLPVRALKKLEPNFRQARNILKEIKSGLGKWENKVRITPRGLQLLPAQIKPGILDIVYESLLVGRRFEAKYQPRNVTEPSKYEVNPMAIVHRNNISYLVCTLWDYSDVKQLAMHRFQVARPLDKDIIIPKGFDIDGYIQAGEFSYPDSDKKIKLKLYFEEMAGKHLYETPLSEGQTIIETGDGRLMVKATVLDTEELRWWLLGFGGNVEVASPKKLRKDIAMSLRSAVDHYE